MTQALVKIIGYGRVSTRKQQLDGHSLDGQRLQIETFARAKGMKVHRFYFDAESARNEGDGSERPEFLKAMQLALKKNWPIVVTDVSRFSRTERTLVDFLAKGGKIYTVEDGFGLDEASLLARAKRAEIDGHIRSEATRRGQKRFVEAGGKLGSPDMSQQQAASLAARRAQSQVRLDEFEQRLQRAANAGHTTPKAIAKHLNRRGFPTPRGQPWNEASVRQKIGALKTRQGLKSVETLTDKQFSDIEAGLLLEGETEVKAKKIVEALRDALVSGEKTYEQALGILAKAEKNIEEVMRSTQEAAAGSF